MGNTTPSPRQLIKTRGARWGCFGANLSPADSRCLRLPPYILQVYKNRNARQNFCLPTSAAHNSALLVRDYRKKGIVQSNRHILSPQPSYRCSRKETPFVPETLVYNRTGAWLRKSRRKIALPVVSAKTGRCIRGTVANLVLNRQINGCVTSGRAGQLFSNPTQGFRLDV